MTVAQTNISLLKSTNRQLQLEIAQQRAYITELEQKYNSLQQEYEEYKKEHPESTNEEEEDTGGDPPQPSP